MLNFCKTLVPNRTLQPAQSTRTHSQSTKDVTLRSRKNNESPNSPRGSILRTLAWLRREARYMGAMVEFVDRIEAALEQGRYASHRATL